MGNIMILRNIRSGMKVISGKITGKKYPIKINFISTYRCDNNCGYCKIGKMKRRSEMSTTEVKNMIDNLSSLGAEHITFIGGEPLLREDIGDLLDYAKHKGLLTTMSSNGNLVKKKSSELDSLDMLIVCLNGPEKVHDAIRGKGNYKKIINLLSGKKDIKKPGLITAIITQQNIGYLDFLLKIARSYGVFINFQPVFRNELAKVENESLKDIILSKEKTKEVFNYLISKKKEGFPISNSYPSLKNFASSGFFKFKKCYLPDCSITIGPEGNVYSCYKYVNSKKSLNGNKVGWKKAFQEKVYDGCKTCYYGCHIEDNLLYGLHPQSVSNLIKLGGIFNDRK